jgi:hypothetical protein
LRRQVQTSRDTDEVMLLLTDALMPAEETPNNGEAA